MAQASCLGLIIRVVKVLIETKAAENQRKKLHQSFVISCQISVPDLYSFVHKLKTNFRYKLSADCTATRITFLIFAAKSTFFQKKCQNKQVMTENLAKNLT